MTTGARQQILLATSAARGRRSDEPRGSDGGKGQETREQGERASAEGLDTEKMAASERRQRAAELFVSASKSSGGGKEETAPESTAARPCSQAGACPSANQVMSANAMPKIANRKDDARGPKDKGALSGYRQVSTIPIGQTDLPNHQDKDSTRWTYPSPQMFYNAMKRKGWQPKEEDMDVVVAIHNTVNERVWEHILRWEELHMSECCQPRLSKFQGRPKDYSPRARILNWLGYKLPFDRHDWIVDRCGEEVRYVIDFYNATSTGPEPVAMHLDVRPALDSFGACFDRMRMFAYQNFFGLSAAAAHAASADVKEQSSSQ